MPPRWLSVAIVVFWLAATAGLFWHDLWPEWRPGEPPPFHIDLVEEMQKGDKPNTYWNVQLNDEDVFTAKTWVDYDRDDDAFTFHAHYSSVRTGSKVKRYVVAKLFHVASMTSAYRVNRAGELRSLQADVEVALATEEKGKPPPLLAQILRTLASPPVGEGFPASRDSAPRLQLEMWGEIQDGRFLAHCKTNAVGTDLKQIDLPPAAVSHNGSVLLPLHPVNRIHGLRPGRTWRQPLVDPFRDAFAALPGFSGEPRTAAARVLAEPQTLTLDEKVSATCLVIEYEDEGEIVGRTWVERDSERVLRQEAIVEGDHWSMTRDNASTGRKLPSRHKPAAPLPPKHS